MVGAKQMSRGWYTAALLYMLVSALATFGWVAGMARVWSVPIALHLVAIGVVVGVCYRLLSVDSPAVLANIGGYVGLLPLSVTAGPYCIEALGSYYRLTTTACLVLVVAGVLFGAFGRGSGVRPTYPLLMLTPLTIGVVMVLPLLQEWFMPAPSVMAALVLAIGGLAALATADLVARTFAHEDFEITGVLVDVTCICLIWLLQVMKLMMMIGWGLHSLRILRFITGRR